ncbi:hypothetical protein CRYUN_Cryun24cG0069800 [Craigia yunnanensis]
MPYTLQETTIISTKSTTQISSLKKSSIKEFSLACASLSSSRSFTHELLIWIPSHLSTIAKTAFFDLSKAYNDALPGDEKRNLAGQLILVEYPHLGKMVNLVIPCALTCLDHRLLGVKNITSTDEIRQYVMEMSVLIVTCIQRDNPRSSCSLETETGAEKTETETDGSSTASQSAGDTEHVSKPTGVSGTIITALANAGYTLEGSEVELVLNPLRLAFETNNLKILEPALDCLHKLIAYDHMEGDPGLDGGKNAPLFIDILNMVCNYADNSSPDSIHKVKSPWGTFA